MYKSHSDFSVGENQSAPHTSYEINGDIVQISETSLIRDADMTRDGMDLVLKGDNGSVVIKGYYAAEITPTLVGVDGSKLTPQLVDSFTKTAPEYAQNHAINDESPVGHVQELTGKATITHLDGSTSEITIGTPVYEGDIIETADTGALNIKFADETTFAVSENARLAIDEYVYDPETNEGSTDFSVLKGVFVFTSGLIGREDPDDVTIDTPMGSIGIRGTIIAGDVNSGEITVVEGAIVLHDTHGNEVTLANQFETAKFDSAAGKIEHMGELSAQDVTAKFAGVSEVSGTLFSSINDAAKDSRETDQVTPEIQKPVEPEIKQENKTQERPAVDKEAAVKDVQPELKAETKETVVEKTIQVLDERAGDIENKLMQNQTAARENIVDMKAATQTVNDLTQSLQDRATQLDTKPKFAPEHVKTSVADSSVPPHKGGANPPANQAPKALLTAEAYAPDGYYKSTHLKTWTYDFSHEFKDANGDRLTFTLDETTASNLDVWESSNFITWSFDSNTGILNIDVLDLAFYPNTTAIPLIVTASDGTLTSDPGLTKSFTLLKPNAELTSVNSITNDTTTPKTYYENNYHSVGINGKSKTIFMKEGIADDFIVNGDTITIHTAESTNRKIIIETTAEGTTIIGGSLSNEIHVKNGNTTIHGLDGDDFVYLDLTKSELTGSLENLKIDLDGGRKSYSQAYHNKTSLTESGLTHGDAILFNTAGTIDLTQIGLLKGIETIQARDSLQQEVTLDFGTVFDMTAAHKTLIFQGDGGGSADTLNLKNSAEGTWRNVSGSPQTIDGHNYNVFEGTDSSGQTVTVLVDVAMTATTHVI